MRLVTNSLGRFIAAFGFFLSMLTASWTAHADGDVEQWGIFELCATGPATGNPVTDADLSASFSQGGRTITVPGFYADGGTYRVRFMPMVQGEWLYTTKSNRPELDGKTGRFVALKPT